MFSYWQQVSLVAEFINSSGQRASRNGRLRRLDKLYLSACSAVQREFGGTRPVRPQVTLVLGADKDEALWDRREIRLIKWNPHLFAQGVVVFAFEDLMPLDERMAVATRAVNWAGFDGRNQSDFEIEESSEVI